MEWPKRKRGAGLLILDGGARGVGFGFFRVIGDAEERQATVANGYPW